MSVTPTSPIVGAPMTGLTSPTYTLTEDTPPNTHSIQYAVTTIGGTQTGVNGHAVSEPFTLTVERPNQLRSAGVANPTTGVISNVPNNVYKIRLRKGVDIDANDTNHRVAMAEIKISVPAGSDVTDKKQLKAMLSALFGYCWADGLAVGDMLGDGIL